MLGLVTSLSIALDSSIRSRCSTLIRRYAHKACPTCSAPCSQVVVSNSLRSGLNYEAGARSPLAGVFSALWVALFAITSSALIARIPIPARRGVFC